MLLHRADDARPVRENRQPSPLLLVLLRQPSLTHQPNRRPITAAAAGAIVSLALAPWTETDLPRPADTSALAKIPSFACRGRLAVGSGSGDDCGVTTPVVARLGLGAEELGSAFYGG